MPLHNMDRHTKLNHRRFDAEENERNRKAQVKVHGFRAKLYHKRRYKAKGTLTGVLLLLLFVVGLFNLLLLPVILPVSRSTVTINAGFVDRQPSPRRDDGALIVQKAYRKSYRWLVDQCPQTSSQNPDDGKHFMQCFHDLWNACRSSLRNQTTVDASNNMTCPIASIPWWFLTLMRDFSTKGLVRSLA